MQWLKQYLGLNFDRTGFMQNCEYPCSCSSVDNRNIIQNVKDVNSTEECQKLCKENASCTFFTYYSEQTGWQIKCSTFNILWQIEFLCFRVALWINNQSLWLHSSLFHSIQLLLKCILNTTFETIKKKYEMGLTPSLSVEISTLPLRMFLVFFSSKILSKITMQIFLKNCHVDN